MSGEQTRAYETSRSIWRVAQTVGVRVVAATAAVLLIGPGSAQPTHAVARHRAEARQSGSPFVTSGPQIAAELSRPCGRVRVFLDPGMLDMPRTDQSDELLNPIWVGGNNDATFSVSKTGRVTEGRSFPQIPRLPWLYPGSAISRVLQPALLEVEWGGSGPYVAAVGPDSGCSENSNSVNGDPYRDFPGLLGPAPPTPQVA